jgi:hypothetical protein
MKSALSRPDIEEDSQMEIMDHKIWTEQIDEWLAHA